MPCSKEKTRVLFVYSVLSSFVQRDLEILERHFSVRRIRAHGSSATFLVPRRGRNPLAFLRLFKGVLWADIVYCWFAELNTFFSVLFSIFSRKKSLVVVGGYDAAYLPEIGYGIFTDHWSAMLTKILYKYVNKILVVDLALKRDILKNTGLEIENKIKVVPTGYDYKKWKPCEENRENLVLTVGGVSWSNLRRKGLETFVKAARYFPDVKFILIGKHLDDSVHYLKSVASSNVGFLGFVSERELIRFFQKTKVYCQLSRYEGLPNALCEAMLCGCIPVGTRKCGIPRAIGNTGFYVPYGDVEATVEGIKRALNSNLKRRKDARERIKEMFPSQRRERELIYHLNDPMRSL